MSDQVPLGRGDIISRLKRIEGQARGIQKMLLEKRDCEDVVIQLAALKAAVNKVCLAVIAGEIEQCVTGDIGDESAREALKKATRMFLKIGG